MIEFLKNIFNRTKKETFFNDSEDKMINLICGVGESVINEHTIEINHYPLKPSVAYPSKTIKANEIDAMSLDFGICKLFTADDIVFVTAEKKNELEQFAKTNNIKLTEHSWNWDWILEPYLDTEYTAEGDQKIIEGLAKKGFKKQEIEQIRAEVEVQMYKYNFDTTLWEWNSLGLHDVLSAMRVKYKDEEYKNFYKRAIEIEKRNMDF